MTKRRVREAAPVQVYLIGDERQRLNRLADQLDMSKSDVVRRGLLALERELLSPSEHPALRLIGIADDETHGGVDDAARSHDAVLADAEEASWAGAPTRLPRGPKRKGRAR